MEREVNSADSISTNLSEMKIKSAVLEEKAVLLQVHGERKKFTLRLIGVAA